MRIISTGNIGFTFSFTVNIIIHDGGLLQVSTGGNIIYCRPDSVFTFLPGSSFIGSSTQLSVYTGASPSAGIGSTFNLGSGFTGPFTIAILVDGNIRTFRSMTCVVRQSGSFAVSATWLGGIAPTIEFCALVGGCDLYIPQGFTLSTASLNGQLNIRFNLITVSFGAFFELGSPGFGSGFRFMFSFTFEIYGTLTYVPSDNAGILIPFGCQFNFYDGAIFFTTVTINVSTYDPNTLLTIGSVISLTNGYSQAVFVQISDTGVTNINSIRTFHTASF